MTLADILPLVLNFILPTLTATGLLWWAAKFLILPVLALWVLYGSLMNLRRAWKAGTLTMPAKVLGSVVLVVGGAVDVYCNLIPFTLLSGLRPPREFLVTTRLKKYRHMTGWPKTLSDFLGRHFLNPLDPTGDHLD